MFAFSSIYRNGRLLIAAVAIGAFAASCSRPAAPTGAPIAEERVVETAPAAPSVWPAPASAPRSTPVPEPPTVAPVPVAAPPAAAPESPWALESRYFAAGTAAEERSEIIQALGSLGTPAAAETLARIFQNDKRLESRMEAFQVMSDLPDETFREQKFAVIQRALAPTMSQVIRLSALQALVDFDDPRAAGALRALSSDRDATIRQMAAEALRDAAP